MGNRRGVVGQAKPKANAWRWLGRGLFALGVVLMVWMWGPWSPSRRSSRAPAGPPLRLERALPIDWPREQWRRFDLTEEGLSFEYPVRWQITPLFGQRAARPVGNLEMQPMALAQFQPPRASLFVQRFQSPRALAPPAWLRRAEEDAALRARLVGDGFDRRRVMVSGIPALRIRTMGVPGSDAQLWEMHTLFFGSGAFAYQVTVTAPQSAIGSFGPAIERILGSVVWQRHGHL
ncbi:MAG: hypothetical protein HY320_08745 [Armatimonadetes bacterium]|nr:hypothetical protein [Armatimonadota bacterium]